MLIRVTTLYISSYLLKLLFLLHCLTLSAHKVYGTTTKDAYYTAGVVEFRPTIAGQTSAQMVAEHVEAYIDILESAEASNTDIIIFPEATLNNPLQLSYVPATEERIIPCLVPNASNYAEFLIQISCAARRTGKYVVINLTEKEQCSANAAHDPRPCAANDLNIYNTNVVFDREGRVISRYRKVHIYMEPKNTTYMPEFAIFETDFGVRFAHFICFDILFYTPAQALITQHGIRDVIFTSMFYSELPFLTAVQLQQSWSWGNNVTLLAAGASYPQSGITGSGIYAGSQGALTAKMVGGTGVRQLFVAQVPKFGRKLSLKRILHKSGSRQTGISLMRDPQIMHFNSELLDLSGSTSTPLKQRICMLDLCCDFTVETSQTLNYNRDSSASSYMYRIGVFSGRRSYEQAEWSDIDICALYACTNASVSSCGTIFPADVDVVSGSIFKHLQVEGNFTKADQLLLMPNSLNEQLYSLQPEQMQWNVNDNSKFYTASVELNSQIENLLTFGIYANYYERSATQPKKMSFTLMMTAIGLWCGVFTVDLLFR